MVEFARGLEVQLSTRIAEAKAPGSTQQPDPASGNSAPTPGG
jgi:hypothetical protein